MKEWLDCCMDVCSPYKYGGILDLKGFLITITIKEESETCPISEIAIIILSL